MIQGEERREHKSKEKETQRQYKKREREYKRRRGGSKGTERKGNKR